MRLIISACLMGTPCRYDGQSKPHPGVSELASKYRLIPVCPEVMGGLSTPRPPCELTCGRALTKDGTDKTEEYLNGAAAALNAAVKNDCTKALLKEKSPSCGSGLIYDGTFSKTLTEGDGITAKLFKQHGIEVFGESDIGKLL